MPLIERVLAATDGSEYGAKAVQTGAALSRRAGASFEVVTIVEVLMLPPVAMAPPAEALEYDDAFTTEALRKAEAQARDADQAEAPIHVYSGFPAPLISRVADERAADLIVLGAHPHPAVARFLVGNTAERVIRTARRPVLVAIEPRTEPFHRILVAIDLSTQSRRVLRAAAAIAKADGAELRALYAREPLPPMLLESGLFVEESYPGLGPDDLAESIAVAELRDIRVEPRVREGRAGDAVLEETAEWDADLVVIGSHGFGFFERLLLGSTSIHILRHSRRATVIVPPIEGE